MDQRPIKGRGAYINPKNRFDDGLQYDADPEEFDTEIRNIETHYFSDHSKTAIAYNSSPDIGFDASLNPYRGCEHGCIYCYARPTHEFFGLSAGTDFESKIMVKYHAPELLRKELASRRWKPQVIAISGVTDAYQPVERKLQITRRCLAVLAEFRNPVGIITKNFLVTRDIDHLKKLAHVNAASVCISITSLDADLIGKMEPRTSRPERRLEAIRRLTDAGIPAGVNIAPVIPGLNDKEIPSILKAASEAGAVFAGFVPLRLPFAVSDLFIHWLQEHFPDRADKVLNHITDMRNGKLNDPRFGNRMRADGAFADNIRNMFKVYSHKYVLDEYHIRLSADAFRRPTENSQIDMFYSS